MEHQIETQWMGKMQFNALISGHTVVMDAPEKAGGEDQGPIPKPLILSSLAGCTGMDVVALLRKADKQVNDFTMKVTAELGKKAPVEYTAIHITYEFKGPEEHMTAALSAVNDSQEKFCGVSHMLKRMIPITWDVFYNGVQIFTNKKINENVNP